MAEVTPGYLHLLAERERRAPPTEVRCQKLVTPTTTDVTSRCFRRAYSNGYCWQHGGKGVPL